MSELVNRKFLANKVDDPNYLGQADSESHGECNHELFCVTGNDSDYIDIDDLLY